jgi:hypothetical protein
MVSPPQVGRIAGARRKETQEPVSLSPLDEWKCSMIARCIVRVSRLRRPFVRMTDEESGRRERALAG